MTYLSNLIFGKSLHKRTHLRHGSAKVCPFIEPLLPVLSIVCVVIE